MKRRALTLIFGAAMALSLSFNATAAPSAKVTQQVESLLNAPEYIPTAKDWKKIGPDAAEVLRDVALNKKVLVLKRGRAAVSLVHFKSPESKVVLTQLVTDTKASWLLRGKAAHALTFSFGAESLQHVQPLLNHGDKRLREAAINALGQVKTAQSRTALQARLKSEKSEHLRKLIEATVAKLRITAKKGGSK